MSSLQVVKAKFRFAILVFECVVHVFELGFNVQYRGVSIVVFSE